MAKGKLENGFQNAGRLLQPKEDQEIRDRLVVLAQVADHPHQIHAHHVAAEREKEGLAEAQQPGVAPEQIHADGQNRIAKIFAVKIDGEIADMQESARRREGVQGTAARRA